MATATAVTGLAVGAAQFFKGREMEKKANNAIENFEWQDIDNAYDDVQVSTMGAELQREEAARNTATAMNAVRSGGTRAIIGSVGKIQANNNTVNSKIAADLDQQQKNIDMASAQYEGHINDMVEKRQTDELQGYGQMANVGMNMKWNGLSSGVNAMGMFGQTPLGKAVDGGITGGSGGGSTASSGGGSTISSGGGSTISSGGQLTAVMPNYSFGRQPS